MVGIVITAYNRALPLKELLESLNKVRFDNTEEIPLVISIDNQGTPEVNKVANDFKWQYGPKEVIIHPDKLGLVKHFIWAGDQTERFDHVIFLEDDLLVSPEMMNYAKQLINFYEDDDDVAGASFYNPILNEFTGTKFYQLEDGYDNFFLQQPYWGNIWFKDKWRQFKEYLETYTLKAELLPERIAKWKGSFKKLFVQYLADTHRYIVTARVPIATNNGCEGLHNVEGLYMYQVNLQLSHVEYRFSHVCESLAVYDVFCEISSDILKRLNPMLRNYDFDVDINGLRTVYNHDYVLTRMATKNAIISYTSKLKPTELGVVLSLPGDERLSLSRKDDIIRDDKFFTLQQWEDINKNYYLRINIHVLLKILLRSFQGVKNIIKYRLLKQK